MSGATALSSPRPIADDTQGGHQAFELQVSTVDGPVHDPLGENFRDDLANPLRADPLLAAISS